MLWLFLVLIAAFIVWFVYLKKPSVTANKKKSPVKKSAPHSEYHCVSVQCGRKACSAVKQLSDTRILSADAPVLPLANCDAASCQCKFQHYDERREGERRDPYNKTLEDLASTTMQMHPRKNSDRRRQVETEDLTIT